MVEHGASIGFPLRERRSAKEGCNNSSKAESSTTLDQNLPALAWMLRAPDCPISTCQGFHTLSLAHRGVCNQTQNCSDVHATCFAYVSQSCSHCWANPEPRATILPDRTSVVCRMNSAACIQGIRLRIEGWGCDDRAAVYVASKTESGVWM